MISQQAYYTASQALKVMGNENARKVLHALRNKNEMDQTQIWIMLRCTDQPHAAYILGKMVRCGLLDVRRGDKSEKMGKHKFYKINVYNMREIRNATKTLNGIRLENQ